MAIAVLPNGRVRAIVKHPETGKRVSAAEIINEPGVTSYRNKTEARKACERALSILRERLVEDSKAPTVKAWQEKWLYDPTFRERWRKPRGKSTTVHQAERTRAFVAKYGDLRLDEITDDIAVAWQDANYYGTLAVLNTMFSDAMTKQAGRLIAYNPFEGMGRYSGEGRKHEDPPTEKQVWELIGAARRATLPSFAQWLQVACFTGMRGSEVDALRWDDVDWGAGTQRPDWIQFVPGGGADGEGWLRVDEQWSVKAQMFTPPKNKRTRYVPMHDDVRAALESARGCDETFCFVNNFGSHWRISSRAYHWNAVRAAVGWDKDLYLASRHFAGWMMYEVMGMKDADVGTALGHTGRDVGKLVRETYGHHNDAAAHQRAREAWRSRNRPDELRAA